jgi:hypothetical protein
MTAIIAACIAAIASIVSAGVAVVAFRGPLHRLEAVSRSLADMNADDPAYATLIEVRRVDAKTIAGAQTCPVRYLVGLWITLSGVSIITSSFGVQINRWSPASYGLLVLIEFMLIVVVGVVFVAIAAVVLVRGGQRLLRVRRDRKGSEINQPPRESSARISVP